MAERQTYWSSCRSLSIAGAALAAATVLLLPMAAADAQIAVSAAWQGVQPATQEIPVGTKITPQNWQQYSQYMTIALQQVFKGTPAVKLPPDATVEVGPYVSIPPPRKYRDDTERYSSNVTLKELPTGGFVPENYVAGAPFPKMDGPNKGAQILYNMYYNYKPWLMYRSSDGIRVISIDRFGNTSSSVAYQVLVRMAHISDVGMPVTLPGGTQGVFLTQYLETVSPEESKYFANLTVFPDDPSQTESVYLFIPSLRRSLRSSAASRCAPLLGGDALWDDLNGGFNGIPAEFYENFLGDRKILWMTPTDRTTGPESIDDYYRTAFFFPKPILGKWALRPVHVLEVKPIPSVLPGYCYPRKILYLDVQTFQIASLASYDRADKLWKGGLDHYLPLPVPNSPGDRTYNSFLDLSAEIVDFQNQHWSPGLLSHAYMNDAVPAKYHNLSRYASPSGLDQIMQ